MFNVTGGELVIILLVALIVLGPDKLPDAIRKVGRVYGELRRMSAGFQSELRDALDEPMREMRDTVNTVKSGLQFGDEGDTPTPAPKVEPEPPTDDGAVVEVEDPTVAESDPVTNGTIPAIPDPNAPVRPLATEEPVVPAEPD